MFRCRATTRQDHPWPSLSSRAHTSPSPTSCREVGVSAHRRGQEAEEPARRRSVRRVRTAGRTDGAGQVRDPSDGGVSARRRASCGPTPDATSSGTASSTARAHLAAHQRLDRRPAPPARPRARARRAPAAASASAAPARAARASTPQHRDLDDVGGRALDRRVERHPLGHLAALPVVAGQVGQVAAAAEHRLGVAGARGPRRRRRAGSRAPRRTGSKYSSIRPWASPVLDA